MGKKRAAKSESSSEESSSEEEEQAKVVAQEKSEEEESSEEEDSSEEEEEAVAKQSPKKKAKTEPAAASGGGCKIFVGGLSWDTTEESFKAFFEDCGEMEECSIATDRETGSSRGFGFITFTDAASAAKAAAEKNELELDGRWLNVKIAEEKAPREGGGKGGSDGPGEPQLKVFVGGLSWETTEETVTEFFKDCGATTDVYFPTDRETGAYRGFCFITFEDLDGAAAAIALNEQELDGRWLKINYSQPREEGGGKGGKGKGKSKGKGGKGKSKGGKGKSKGKSW